MRVHHAYVARQCVDNTTHLDTVTTSLRGPQGATTAPSTTRHPYMTRVCGYERGGQQNDVQRPQPAGDTDKEPSLLENSDNEQAEQPPGPPPSTRAQPPLIQATYDIPRGSARPLGTATSGSAAGA